MPDCAEKRIVQIKSSLTHHEIYNPKQTIQAFSVVLNCPPSSALLGKLIPRFFGAILQRPTIKSLNLPVFAFLFRRLYDAIPSPYSENLFKPAYTLLTFFRES
jgi:hypothetical protein